jgi:membrane protease YdiL (CAAX protease family)
MELSSIFLNQQDRPRSGWRLLIFIFINFVLSRFFVLAMVACLYLIVGLPEVVQRLLSGLPGWIVQSVALLAAATLSGLVCGKLLEGLPVRALGWALHGGWLFDWLKGTMFGALSLVLAAVLIFVGGGYQFSFSSQGAGAVIKTLVFSGLFFILAASAEEVIFRGYPLQTMTRARLVILGLVLTSLVFAYIHKDNPNNPPGVPPFTYIGLDFINLPFINTALAGVWLAAGYLRTRSLWFPLGLHWSWNWTMGSVLGLPVSGIEALSFAPLFHAKVLGPAWLTGGAYGVEGGLACTLALLVSTIFIWRTTFLSATPEMLSLTDKENPKTGLVEEELLIHTK